jgi:hypothetical protein
VRGFGPNLFPPQWPINDSPMSFAGVHAGPIMGGFKRADGFHIFGKLRKPLKILKHSSLKRAMAAG